MFGPSVLPGFLAQSADEINGNAYITAPGPKYLHYKGEGAVTKSFDVFFCFFSILMPKHLISIFKLKHATDAAAVTIT